MADDIIKVRIEADMDFSDARNQLKAASDEIRGMKEEMADMPNVSRLFNSSLEKTASIVDSVAGKVETLSQGRFEGNDDKKARFIQGGNEAIKDVNVMRGLQVGSSAYGIQIARQWFKDLPQAVQQEFDAITPRITTILRSRMSSLSRDGIHFEGSNIAALTTEMFKDAGIMKVVNQSARHANDDQIKKYFSYLIPNAVAHNRINQWHEARYGSVMSSTGDAMVQGKPETLFPASYVSSFKDAHGYRRTDLSEPEARKVLSKESFAQLEQVFAKNPIAVRAAIASGISHRDDRGVLETRRDLTRDDWERMREAMYGELENRATGAGKSRIDFYGQDAKTQRDLARRLTSSSAGMAMLAMHATEAMSSPDAWVEKTNEAGYVKQAHEARRVLDRYATLKYSPFMSHGDWDKNPYAKDNAQFVMIPESQGTKLVSGGKWQNNQDISDTVALISLAGYNPEDKTQFNAVRDIYANGRTINGVQMVAAGTHGNGDDTVIRMISKEARDRVEAQEQEWARQNGFSGSFFQNFTDVQRAEMAAYDAKHPEAEKPLLSVKTLGKQYDAENKSWSPSADMGLNLEGKRFAVVDLNGEGDGSAWVSRSVMPYANQSRFAVAGKGSVFTFGDENNREFAKRSGFLDDQGRWMARGLNGEMYDISGYDGIIPADVIKNLNAYGHIDQSTGEFVYGKKRTTAQGGEIFDNSNEAVSEMVTAAIQRYGFRAIANYENEGTNSNRLGAQMTSFMRISPEMREHQAEMYAQRMRELDTEEGQLRYVFTNPEEDWVAAQVNAPGGRQLLSTPTARARVDAYRNSLQQAIAAGQYIDFGQEDTKISDIRLADNPLRALLAETSDEATRGRVLGKMRTAMSDAYDERVRTLIELDNSKDSYADKLKRAEATVGKERKRDYTDQELLDLINLTETTDENGKKVNRVIDFAHMNQSHVGVLRSPTGYGNMVYAQNVASEIAPIFDAFRMDKTGAFVSKDALETLQSADYDGDRAKIVTGNLADAVKKTREMVDEQTERIAHANTDIQTKEVKYDASLTDDDTQRTHEAGRRIQEVQLMGGSSAGIRGMQVDLSNTSNNEYLIAQQKMQKMYDKNSVWHKNPEEVILNGESEYWDTEKLGREFTKFTDKAHTVLQYDSDQLDKDNKVKTDAADIYWALKDPNDETSKGIPINMRHLKDLNLDQTNLPSINMDAHLMGLGQSRGIYLTGGSDTTTWDAIAEALQHLEFAEGTGEKTKALMSKYRQMFPEFGSGARGLISRAETEELQQMTAEAKAEIAEQSKSAYRQGFGIYVDPQTGNEYKSKKNYLQAQYKKYGIDMVENATEEFGMTEQRVETRLGAKTAKALSNDPTIAAMNDAVAESVVEQAEETAKATAEEVKNEAKTSKGKRSKTKRSRSKKVEAPTVTPEPPEEEVVCDICGTTYPASLGECPNAANHRKKQTAKQTKRDQATLSNIQKAEVDPNKTFEENFGKVLNGFAGIESSKALAEKMMQDFDDTIKGHRRTMNANKEQTAADKFFGIETWKRDKAHKDFDWATANLDKSVFGEGTAMREAARERLDQIDSGYVGATRQWASDKSKNIVEGMRKSVTGVGDEFDKQQAQVEAYANSIKELESVLENFQQSRAKLAKEAADNGSLIPESVSKKDAETVAQLQKDLAEAQALRDQGIQNIKTKNNQSFMDRAGSLYDQMYGKTASPLEKIDRQVSGYQSSITTEMARLEEAKAKDKITEEDYLARKQQFEGLQDYTNGRLREDLYNKEFDKISSQTDRMMLQSDRLSRQRRARTSMSQSARFMMQNESEYQQREQMQTAMQTRMDELITARDGRLDEKTGERIGGMGVNTKEYARATAEINKLSEAMEQNKSAMDGLKGVGGALKAVFSSMTTTVSRLAQRFGRQLFMKAINEAKRFVKEFDRSMTTIQMITLKSDSQMSKLGDGLIAKSKELKVSISDIAKSAEALYRQGLSDQEVNDRLEIISKFSKVSGTKVDAATKLVTVAMNTGLVSDPQMAADIVTALGDNAATNASEIEKGIEKAGAAAAADGTTFGQLAAMLTAITSTTQIGGSTAGRTLNTIFGRMNKIGTNELITDANGYKISGSAVAKLLQKQGIDTYDTQGNKRSSYDVLYDLSQKWEEMSDAEQQQIATAIAGTRQYSNFAAIMQGMSEGKVDEYMELVGTSSGITDQKYEVYTKSLEAALTNLKNTFDELVKDLTDNGTLTGIINTISSMIQGVDNLTKAIGPLGAALTTVIPLLAGLTMMKIGLQNGSWQIGLAGLAVAGIGAITAGIAGGDNGPTADERIAEVNKNYEEQKKNRDEAFNKYEELKNKTNRTEKENEEFFKTSKDLAIQFGLIDSSAASTITSMEQLTKTIKDMGETSGDTDDAIEKAKEEEDRKAWAQRVSDNITSSGKELHEDLLEDEKGYNSSENLGTWVLPDNRGIWKYDKESDNWVLEKGAGAAQNSYVTQAMLHEKALIGWLSNSKYGWNKDIKEPLSGLYAKAANAGRIRGKNGEVLEGEALTPQYWANLLEHGNVHEYQMQGMLDWYNEFRHENGSLGDQRISDRKAHIKERLINDFGLNEFYSDDEIDKLAEIGTDYLNQHVNETDSGYKTFSYLLGGGVTAEDRMAHINQVLKDNNYEPSVDLSKTAFDLEDVGPNGYYVDEYGKHWTKQEVEEYNASQQTSNRDRAVRIMQAHNEQVVKEHEEEVARIAEHNESETARAEAEHKAVVERLEQEAETKYQDDLLAEAKRLAKEDGHGTHMNQPAILRAYAKDVMLHKGLINEDYELTEDDVKEYSKTFADETRALKDKYITEYGNPVEGWEYLTPEDQNKYLELAKASVQKHEVTEGEIWEASTYREPDILKTPELDESKLIGGVNATVEALGEIYDQGELLPEIAKEINKAEKESESKLHKFTAVTNTFVDAMSSYDTGQNSWLTKNATGVSADSITSLLISGRFGSGRTGLTALMNHINENSAAGADWTTLVQNNPELQHVLHQIDYNSETHEFGEVPEDIMDQILRATRNGSLTYGSAYLTTQEKGQIAQKAYEGITSQDWFISQEQKDKAQDEAWNKYQEEVLVPYNAQFNELESKYPDELKREKAYARLNKQYPTVYQNREDFIASRADLNAAAMNLEQRTYLQEALGEQMFDRVLEASQGGKALTGQEQKYIQTVLNNRANGLTSITTGQRLQGIKDVREAIKSGSFVRDAAADEYMSQWSGWGEYAALLSKKSSGTLTAEDEKRIKVLEASLDNFQENAEIQFKIEGIKELETAGKVIEGTAKNVEKLQKGGTIALEVLTKIRTESYANGQQYTKLLNGSAAERAEAAMAITGMGREQYYANEEQNYQYALSVGEQQRTQQGDTFVELFNGAANPQQRGLIKSYAYRQGFKITTDSKGHAIGFEDAGAPEQTNVDTLVGEQRTYTEAERNNALDKILSGEMTRTVGKNGNSELYDAAIANAGTYTRELLRRKANNETIDPWLQIASDNERSTARTSEITGFSSRVTQASQAQYALANLNNPESASYLATFLGMNEADVKRMMGSEEGKAELRARIKSAQTALYSEMAQSLGIELDTSDLTTMKTQLQEAADNAEGLVKEFLLWMINSIDDAGDIVGSAGNKSFSEVISESQSGEIKKRDALAYIGNIIANGNYASLLSEESGNGAVDYSQIDSALLYMLNDRATNGESSQFSQEMINNAYQNALMGRNSSPQTQQAVLSHLFGNDLSSENMVATYRKWMEDPAQYAAQLGAFNGLEDIEDIRDALSSETSAVERTTEAMRRYNQEMGVKGLQYAEAFGDQTDEVTNSLLTLAKGGKTAQRELAALSRKAYDTQDAMTAWYEAYNGGKVKSGKQVSKSARTAIASYLGIGENEVEMFTQSDMEQLFANDRTREGIEQDMTNVVNTMFNDAISDIQAKAANGELSFNGQQITYEGAIDFIMNPNGTVNMENLIALATAAESDAVGLLQAMAQGKLAEWVATLRTEGSGDSFRAWIDASTTTNAKTKNGKYAYNNRGKSGGGGGGKSKTDALIEGQSHYIKRREHDVNMAQEREARYEKTNNYQGYLNALNDEIAAQERLKSQYAANITALKEQLATLKEGSEEWYKCQEAIDSAEEAMAKIDNEIDNINTKKINITETKQSNEDKPISHASTMLKLKAESYLEQGQFEKYEAVTRAQIANYANDIQLNNKQIEEWEELLATYEEGSQDWLTVRDKIWALKEENAELENNMLKETHELEKAKIAQIATDLQNAMAPIEHEQNMLNTWGGIYQKGHQYGAYRGALASENAYNEGQKALYQNSITELQKQMKTLEVGSQAWLDARAAIFEYEEALASVTASIQENDAAIEESYVTEVTEHYEDASKSAEHELKMAQLAAEGYKNEGDYTNYEHMLEVQRDLTGNKLSTQINSLGEMETLFNSGKLKEGSDQWKALREQIMSLRETIAQAENDYASMVRQVRETKFENAVEQFNTKDNELQHEIKMVQYDETKYQNAGELTNYGKALEYDNGLQQKRANLIQDQIDLLKEQRDAAKDDPQLYNKIDAEIMKMEEQLASTNNTIEKNNKLIEKNQDAIRKLQQNIENTLDKEIKAREKLERDMLAGTITSQNSILEVIKKRYQDEFNLIKKDIENKKKALNEEKSLINERLNARKKAIDEEDKYETLAEYQKQLALISADPTRSKDAKELRRKIADLQKEISWSIAEDEAKAATEALDDQIKALDDYVQVEAEDLAEMLENSNNFADELNQILGGSFEDYVAWMKENSESYKNATAETRKQMEQGWHDTWLKMKGETETYWDEIAALMQNKDDFLAFMKQSQEYINASESGKASLEYQWAEAFDEYQASLIDNAEFGDNHDVLEKMSEMKDWTYKVEPIVDPNYDYGQYSTGIEYWYQRQKDNATGVAQEALGQAYDQYSSVIGSQASLYESQRKKEDESNTPEIIVNVSGGGGSSGNANPNSDKTYKYEASVGYEKAYGAKGTLTGTGEGFSADEAKLNAYNEAIKKAPRDAYTIQNKDQAKYTKYKHGGLIDFTGPAWVDGTPSQPEGILSAYDTKAIQALTDVLTRVYVSPGYSPSSDYFRGNTNIGDINVTINQAELKDDADFEDVAKRVGRAFTKQLSKEGFNLSRYAF